MKIRNESKFKDVSAAQLWFDSWVYRLEKENSRIYQKIELTTALGNTTVYALNLDLPSLEPLVIFPGARTTALFWDMNRNLDVLKKHFRIFLVETNGLPNLSDGKSPDIRTLDYGRWASEVLERLGISKTFIAGASFGGLICAKLCLVSPSKVKASFLLNPGCLQPFSIKPKNLYYNLLPIISPTRKNIATFLDKAIFCKPHHAISSAYEDLIIEYELYALTQYKDRTQKPYYMGQDLKGIKTSTYMILGKKDILFPYRRTLKNATHLLPGLRDVVILENTGHGIETSTQAMKYLANWALKEKQKESREVSIL
ncbi:MAG: alpha/beta fold hydrolase [Cyclobacteriaceae bacterium]